MENTKKVITATDCPAAIGPYSQAVIIGKLLFTSGQLGLDPASGVFCSDDIEGQTRQALRNIDAILKEAGIGKEQIVKTTVYMKNMDDFAAMNKIYGEFFEGTQYPARSAVEVARLPKNALVEIEVIAGV